MVELKPCPFCGSSAHVEQYGDRRQSTKYQCDNCGCMLETGEEWGHGNDWNRRASPPAIDMEEVIRVLEFYGDKKNYERQLISEDCGCCSYWHHAKIGSDGDEGELARSFLDKLNAKEGKEQ